MFCDGLTVRRLIERKSKRCACDVQWIVLQMAGDSKLVFFHSGSANIVQVTLFGVGRLGICTALCLEKAGYNVLGVDVNQRYVSRLALTAIYLDVDAVDTGT